MVDSIKKLMQSNSRDEFKSSVLIDQYKRHIEEKIKDKKYPILGKKRVDYLNRIFKGLSHSNLKERIDKIRSNKNFGMFIVDIFHDPQFFIINILYPIEVKNNYIEYHKVATVYDLKRKKGISSKAIAYIKVPIHAMERFIQRSRCNSLNSMLKEINLLTKVNILCSAFSKKQSEDCIIDDVATRYGVWMGDVSIFKTFVNVESLHSSDVGVLTQEDIVKMEKAFCDYNISYARDIYNNLHQVNIEKNVMKIIQKYDLYNYFAEWNLKKEKRLERNIF
jgi:hypothetical protein